MIFWISIISPLNPAIIIERYAITPEYSDIIIYPFHILNKTNNIKTIFIKTTKTFKIVKILTATLTDLYL